jgi:hypothetical protein
MYQFEFGSSWSKIFTNGWRHPAQRGHHFKRDELIDKNHGVTFRAKCFPNKKSMRSTISNRDSMGFN